MRGLVFPERMIPTGRSKDMGSVLRQTSGLGGHTDRAGVAARRARAENVQLQLATSGQAG